MSSIESQRYNTGLKCKYAKISLLTTKMIQHNGQVETQFQTKKIQC